jgi:hypothetical protein
MLNGRDGQEPKYVANLVVRGGVVGKEGFRGGRNLIYDR